MPWSAKTRYGTPGQDRSRAARDQQVSASATRVATMAVLRRIYQRTLGLLCYWGVVKHPYGREYAQWRYTRTGRFIEEPIDPPPELQGASPDRDGLASQARDVNPEDL